MSGFSVVECRTTKCIQFGELSTMDLVAGLSIT